MPDECHWPDYIKNYSPILDCGHYFGADRCDISGELCKVVARFENCNMKGDQWKINARFAATNSRGNIVDTDFLCVMG